MNDQPSPTNRAKTALLARESINSLLNVKLRNKTIEVCADDIESYLQSLAERQLLDEKITALKQAIVSKNSEIAAHTARCITLKLDEADWWVGESIDSAIASVKAISPSKIKPA